MKQSKIRIACAFASAAICCGAHAQGTPDSSGFMSVYLAYQDALNAGDAPATLATWADSATFAGGLGCPAAKPCVGRDAVRAGFVEPAIAMKMQHQMIGSPKMISAEQAEVRIEVSWPGMDKNAADVKRLVGTDMVRVQGGRIVSKVYVPDLSDQQTRAFYDAVERARQSADATQR